MKNANDLRQLLRQIDHKSYPAYKDTRGSYRFPGYILNIDHVQGDPFAAPSKVSIQVAGKEAGFPTDTYDQPHKRIALQDHILRLFSRALNQYSFKARGSGKSGLIGVSRCGQEILERTACQMDPKTGNLLVRMEVGFPADGRRINSGELIKILFDFLPECIPQSLFYKKLDARKIQQVKELSEDQHYIRQQLQDRKLTAFVANGTILPRESGISARPMKGAVPFQSPSSLEITLDLPNHGPISGMGIPQGITLIVGGGYHGKSTLLKALELGVYDHIAGDGREYVATDESAVKIRAEDGRSIKKADISMFINNLPNNRDTRAFSTEDASGSTSQAANVVEAMEGGARLFLIDEDTCATNFMVRDDLMQRVVHRNQEPITPFIERVRQIYQEQGISSILVAGSSGSYFHVADTILQMNQYKPMDITELAKQEAKAFPLTCEDAPKAAPPDSHRCPRQSSAFRKNDRIKMKTMGKDAFSINKETVDLRYVEQLVDSEQTTALAYLLKYMELHCFDGRTPLKEIVPRLSAQLLEKGLASINEGSYLPSSLAMPRPQEIYACINRYRGLML
ncbi:MAG: ABC-ATPase domain-containing protein [Lachnospiraceae bacterium]|nr:ABC-ATPase domain-containing protein [Lachnospiraceae bacterium]